MRGVAVCSWALWLGLASAGRGETAPAPSPTITAVPSHEAKPAGDNDQPAVKVADPERSQEGTQKRDQAAGTKQQIRIDLKICELSLPKRRGLGIDILELGLNSAAPDRSRTTSAPSADATRLALAGVVNADGFAGVVEMLRRKNGLKVLAENQHIVTEGRTEFFLSPAETASPVLSPDWLKQSFIRELGTQVDLTATLMGADRIRLDVRAKLSEIDPSVSITLNGWRIPGLTKREMDAAVEMELGKTAVLGGLVQENVQVVVDPKTHQKSNVRDTTQLLVLIKPELVGAAAE